MVQIAGAAGLPEGWDGTFDQAAQDSFLWTYLVVSVEADVAAAVANDNLRILILQV